MMDLGRLGGKRGDGVGFHGEPRNISNNEFRNFNNSIVEAKILTLTVPGVYFHLLLNIDTNCHQTLTQSLN